MHTDSVTETQVSLPHWPRLLGSQQASAYLGISKTTFLMRVKQHILPAPRRIGGRVLWDIKMLDAFVDVLFESTVKPVAAPVNDRENWEHVVVKDKSKRSARVR